ncbi:MAG: hypothetical protein OEZ04_10080 [Nitrospinota bacterium]|nr:hypothetical protein [Nitrospinota bacterium]
MTRRKCADCAKAFGPGEAQILWRGRSVKTELAIRCLPCEEARLEKLGAACANCGGPIFPHTQVSVMVGLGGARQVAHSTFECSPAGGAFYGYWGEGKLESSYERIEQC